jgi:hypothetical protein
MNIPACACNAVAKFRAMSGPHLAAVEYLTGFAFSAPPEAFPQLQHLAYVYTRLAHGLPPGLERLGLMVGRLHTRCRVLPPKGCRAAPASVVCACR